MCESPEGPKVFLGSWTESANEVTLLLLFAVDFFNAEKRERLIFQLLLAGP